MNSSDFALPGSSRSFQKLASCTKFLGCTPVVSKFGVIVKEKTSGIKRRLILDAEESGVTRCAKRNQRIILPHVLDVVYDGLSLGGDGSPVDALMLDASEACWTSRASVTS